MNRLTQGAFTPSEVEFMGHVFDLGEFANESPADQEARAERIVAHYKAGVTDEAKLVRISRRTPSNARRAI